MTENVAEDLPTPEVESNYSSVAILDAGAQYGKVIDRKIRGLQVRSVILPLDTPASELQEYGAIVISGGPESVYAQGAPDCDGQIFELDKPILGICYGMQLINHKLGGRVGQGPRREDGQCEIIVEAKSSFFQGLQENQSVLMSHGDSVLELAPGFESVAYSDGLIAAIQDPQRKIYGVQFHPEVHLTTNGKAILGNFLFEIAGLEANYPLEDRAQFARKYIIETVRDRVVLMFSSGGVDSTVTTVLLFETLGQERVHVVHIGSDLMREKESASVLKQYEKMGIPVHFIDATKTFARATTEIDGVETPPLDTVTDPEVKRKIIGDTFMKVKDRALIELGLDPERVVLGQGTLRPDLIESASKMASGKAQVIKTHHNDTELVRRLRREGRVVEPLTDFHKDEVRELGVQLGIDEDFIYRHPFPGPGLAIRVLCSDGESIDGTQAILDEVKDLVPPDVSVVVLPIKSVGVQGDGKSYSYAVGLSGELDWQRRFDIARAIPKKVRSVNRVVHIFGPEVNNVGDVTPTYLTSEVLNQLRQADAIVTKLLEEYGLVRTISQCPVVLAPVDFGVYGNRSIILRPFLSPDFMTGEAALPGRDLPEAVIREMVDAILNQVPGISRVMYDMTSKPPGTTEWE